jgi:hypothetical protein
MKAWLLVPANQKKGNPFKSKGKKQKKTTKKAK